MWDDGNNTKRDQAAELKDLRIKYIKIVSRCRKLERQLQDNNNTIDSLREENETLRLTPLLVKGGGNVARPQSDQRGRNSGSANSSVKSKSHSRILYLERVLNEKDETIRKLTRARSAVKTREIKVMNEEYAFEVARLRSILYGSKNEAGDDIMGLSNGNRINATQGTSKTANKQLIRQNKKLARRLMFEKDRYRRYLVSEMNSDKLLDAEIEPSRYGFSMGDVIEAQQTEIEKLNKFILRLKEKNEVLAGRLGTMNAIHRLND